jgi:hypothetical protein
VRKFERYEFVERKWEPLPPDETHQRSTQDTYTDSEEVVDGIAALRGVQRIRAEIEALDGIADWSRDFGAIVAWEAKALQMQHQDRRRFPDGETFQRLLVFLALVAVPVHTAIREQIENAREREREKKEVYEVRKGA